MTPRALILTGNGFNTQENLAMGFRLCKATADLVPLQRFLQEPEILLRYQIWGIPGGFSYGDRIGAGRIAAHLMNRKARKTIQKFLKQQGIILGVCNGFQVLLKMNLLPDPEKDVQQATLTFNKDFYYENKWMALEFNKESPCIWTKGLTKIKLPYLAREGRLLIEHTWIQNRIVKKNLNAIVYGENKNCTNGSFENIAGLCNESGQILGILPHPEFVLERHHTLNWEMSEKEEPTGLCIFENGISFVKQCHS